MKHTILLGLLSIGLINFNQLEVQAETNEIKIVIDGIEKKYDQAPLIKDERTYIPIRGVSETTGSEVTWNQEQRSVTIQKRDNIIVFKELSDFALVNGVSVQMPQSFVINGRTMVPIRFVSEVMKYQVIWNSNLRSVLINTPTEQRINDMISFAETYIGTPYLFGGEYLRDKKFDCSSFTQYLFKQIGINLPRTSINQSVMGVNVENNQLRKGDLVFFDTNKDGVINHVAIYIDENKLFHSTSSLGVNYTTFSSYWKSSWVKNVRVVM